MQKEYNANELDTLTLQCDKCGWEGKASEANLIDFYGVTADKELHCPTCDHTLATVKTDDKAVGDSGDSIGFQIG